MKLPNAEHAVVELQKLEDYCLNPAHPRGKHKARVFANALGICRADARELRERILKEILVRDCECRESDAYGSRYIVDMTWLRQGRAATVRTTWIVKRGEHVPRLTSCYVL